MNSSDLAEVRRTLWAAADQLRANSALAPNEYSGPVLGLIFLASAEHRFEQVRPEVEAKATARRPTTPDDYRARSVLFISDEARLSYLIDLTFGMTTVRANEERSALDQRLAAAGVPRAIATDPEARLLGVYTPNHTH